jgi:signal transduction histidine kinase
MRRIQVHLALALFCPAFIIPFFFFFGREGERERLRRLLPLMITLGVLLAAAALLVPAELVVNRFQLVEGGGLWRVGVTGLGEILAMLALAANVLILHSFENTYRSAGVPDKVKLKYPLLGVILASIINFIVMTRLIVLGEVDDYLIAAAAIGLIFFCITVLFAGWRYPLFEVRAVPEKGRAPSVVAVVVSGLYLLAFALITWTSNLIGVPYERFGTLVAAAFAAFMILAVFVSGRARRRARIFINDNFRPGLYNYRREWRRFARLMTSSSTVEELVSNTVSSLCQTMMVSKGLIYAAVDGGSAADYGLGPGEIPAESCRTILETYDGTPLRMIPQGRGSGREGTAQDGAPAWFRAVSFLTIGGEAKGFIALGDKEFGRLWSDEDREFLATISDQAALSLENLLMEERYLESKQLESFNRFASFVIHDLKNTVGMLSLTAENARDNIHDREFQEDAIDTVERSVHKMRRLIDSLNAHKTPAAISRSMTDAAAPAEERVEALRGLASRKGVKIEFERGSRAQAYVDPSAISRITENLVLNSIEAVPEGGTVRVGIELRGHTLGISVTDDGPGFDSGYMMNGLFRPFMSTKKNGLGVGLVLCKSLAEAHGGTISVSNLPGGGALVEVEIPADG